MVPFWGGAPPILVYFSGDWDVHWGYDLDFDPWPNRQTINKLVPTYSNLSTARVS